MFLFKLIAIIFKGSVFFIGVGLVCVIGSAMVSALWEAPMEDGSTFGDVCIEGGAKLSETYGPYFEDVDVKEVLKQDAKELEQLGREKVSNLKHKIKPVANDPELQQRLKEAQELIDKYTVD